MSEQTTSQSLTVPLNEDGSIGTLPDPLQKLIDRRISEAVNRVKAKTDPPADPVERERLRQVEAELQQHKVAEAEREKRYEEALKLRETDWQKQVDAKDAEIARRTQRLAQMLGSEIRAAALKHGAREESVEDIEVLLGHRVALNDDLDVIIVGDDGQPVPDGTIDALVADALDRKPYFRKAPGAVGGGARGGASTRGVGPDKQAAYKTALEAFTKNPTGETLRALQDAKAAQEE